ncbi:MAG: phenylacetate--CoA ligase family protein [Mongoliibacter sp.]|uniref:phenylacetate--CoA ligase family protein n=1 Tax=Mongoliibacter sp. TaxID=2022438 RepID=UPI0012F0D165|nr:AMP-binding protein [Mongoliibacter sp.]TVP46540.1 MAG: phenylacetate--CoA ligase family protein [Mongoliibacter sp.]
MMYSFLLKNFLLPFGDKFLGGGLPKKIKELQGLTRLSAVELKSLQNQKLGKVLQYAILHSPYYQALDISPSADPEEFLSKFPILDKQTVRDKIDQLITKKSLDGLQAVMSSGSTGPPSKVYFNKEEMAATRAVQLTWWSWAGYEYGNSILQTGVNLNRSREKRIKDIFFRTKYIEALKHHEDEMLKELHDLRKKPKDHYVAYASSLYLFAKTALDHGLSDIRFKSVISLGEKLLPNFREAIEQAFHCKVYDTYGSSEGLMVASQCSHGSYHIMTPHVYLEVVDENGNEVGPGEMGRVLLTGLDNYTTPLIRYEIGDLAIKSKKTTCDCGMELPMLEEVLGRTTEFLKTPQNKYITVQTVVRVLKFFPEVEQFTLIQKTENSFQLQYISKEQLDECSQQKIKESFETLYKESFLFDFQQVELLPRSKSGKFQLIINEVHENV